MSYQPTHTHEPAPVHEPFPVDPDRGMTGYAAIKYSAVIIVVLSILAFLA